MTQLYPIMVGDDVDWYLIKLKDSNIGYWL